MRRYKNLQFKISELKLLVYYKKRQGDTVNMP